MAERWTREQFEAYIRECCQIAGDDFDRLVNDFHFSIQPCTDCDYEDCHGWRFVHDSESIDAFLAQLRKDGRVP